MNSTEFCLVLRPLGLSATFWQRFLESIGKERMWKIINILFEHLDLCQQSLITLTSLAVCSKPADGLFLRLVSTSGADDKLRLDSMVPCHWSRCLCYELPQGKDCVLLHHRVVPWCVSIKLVQRGVSLMGQQLGLHVPNTGGPGSIPGPGTRSHMPPLRPRAAK